MKKTINKITTLILVSVIISSCSSDLPEICTFEYSDGGYFVTNEGNFGSGNGSVSFVSIDGIVQNNIFECVNSSTLGDVVQSMTIIDSSAYIVINNSSKIEVVDVETMRTLKTINTVVSPRYITQVSNTKAYVSDWQTNSIHVLDLNNLEISSTISVGNGPEKMIYSNGYVYVCNVGGFGYEKTISIIDVSNDIVINTVEVGDKPNSIVSDANENIWVLCGGYTEYDTEWNVVSQTAGSLVKITGNSIVSTFNFDVGNSPSDLVINDNGTSLFYSDGSWSKNVYKFNISDLEITTTPIISRSFYGLGYNDGYIYGSDAVDYVQNGWSYKYTESGTIVDSVQVGIIPGGYCFN
ncbi:MAG: hypothetical protein CMD02_05880 [Flavobacteriales bacterium]|nr:hypothetical protein [Flavobacteriales bacterium]|tara:strand:+ start:68 stop:1123 length:1056 start_codon:yes stop_codon:yes gene_type:complete